MSQPKDRKLVSWLERDFADMVYELAVKHDLTVSAYVRKIMIEELIRSGMINMETLAKVTA